MTHDATAKSQEIVLSDLVPIDRMGNQVALPQVGMPGASNGADLSPQMGKFDWGK